MKMVIGAMLSITAGNARVRVSWIDRDILKMIEGNPESVRRFIPESGARVRHIGFTERYGEPVIVYDLGEVEVMK